MLHHSLNALFRTWAHFSLVPLSSKGAARTRKNRSKGQEETDFDDGENDGDGGEERQAILDTFDDDGDWLIDDGLSLFLA